MLKTLPTAVTFDRSTIFGYHICTLFGYYFFYQILAQVSRQSVPLNTLEKADLLLLNTYTILKTQLLADKSNTEEENNPASEPIWKSNAFFGDEKLDFEIGKNNYPENKLFYLDQA